MLMKWFDLEAGDIIKVSKIIEGGYYSNYKWAQQNLKIIECIHRNYLSQYPVLRIKVITEIDKEQHIFEIFENGVSINAQTVGPFFEIVSLRED